MMAGLMAAAVASPRAMPGCLPRHSSRNLLRALFTTALPYRQVISVARILHCLGTRGRLQVNLTRTIPVPHFPRDWECTTPMHIF